MLPKTGDLKQLMNFVPITILQILYKWFARIVYHMISKIRFAKQSQKQFGFTPGVRIENTLMIAEFVAAYYIELNFLFGSWASTCVRHLIALTTGLYLKPLVITYYQMAISLFFSISTLTNMNPRIKATRSKSNDTWKKVMCWARCCLIAYWILI